MKTIEKQCCWLILLLLPLYGIGQQRVGIGVNNPTEALSVGKGLNIDHENANDGISLTNGLRFGNTQTASQMVGISSNRVNGAAGVLYGLDFYTSNTRRISISPSGTVGINTEPSNYFLDVGGTIKGQTLRAAGSVHAESGSLYSAYSIYAGTSINAQAGNITASEGNIVATQGNIIATNGALQADGKGVIMSNSSNRQRIVSYTATLSVTGLAPGSSVTGNIDINEGVFTSAPNAFVGQVIKEDGEYYKAMLVLENVTTTNITVRVVNVGSDNISFSGAQWRVMAIGVF